ELERTTETGRLNLTVFRDDVKLKHGMENRVGNYLVFLEPGDAYFLTADQYQRFYTEIGDEAAKEKYLRERRKVLPRGTKRRSANGVAGGYETQNHAAPGDYIALGAHGEQYVIAAHVAAAKILFDTCTELPPGSELAAKGFKVYDPNDPPKMVVEVTEEDLPPGGRFMAAWNEVMMVKTGDFIIGCGKSHGQMEVYRVDRETFLSTYTRWEEPEASCKSWSGS
ncbi:unnamed protein product, partial [Cladocopium goreaui]